ncbi:MAG: hypothetical protein V4497_01330 [Bacteroidota bacterium]
MKKLLLLTALLIGFLCQAQDFDFLKKTYRSDIEFTRQFADSVAVSFGEEYNFLGSRESKRGDVYSIVYLPVSVSEETKKRIKESIDYAYTGDCIECLKVHFKIFKEGENKDLQIGGTKKYMFNVFEGKFLDVLPFWKKHINPSAAAEEISSKGYASIRNETNKIIFNLRRDASGLWSIQNYTDRIAQ